MPKKKIKKNKPLFYAKRISVILVALILACIICWYTFKATRTTYVGTFPCADCSGIQIKLIVYTNHSYELEQTYIGRGAPYIETGTWQQEAKNDIPLYILTSGKTTTYYAVVNDHTLQMLDTHANAIVSPFNTFLTKE